MTAGCMVCGTPLDDLGIVVDVTFHAGLLGPRAVAEVPHRMRDIELCSEHWRHNQLLRALLESGRLEALTELRGRGCRVECTGHRRGRAARFWSPFRVAYGVPPGARCPVCWGPIEVPEEA